jgi:hypothetical protein
MPDLVNMPGDPLLARILPARRRVAQVGVADLGLREGDAGVLEEEVREGDDARAGVDEGDGEGDEEQQEARAGLHLVLAYRAFEAEAVVVPGRVRGAIGGEGEVIAYVMYVIYLMSMPGLNR